jgi:hypothetical protein
MVAIFEVRDLVHKTEHKAHEQEGHGHAGA